MTIPAQIPSYALPDLLLILNAYGAFLKERELVRRINKSNGEASSAITHEISQNILKEYHYTYEDYSKTDGLTTVAAEELCTLVSSTLETQNQDLSKSLISTEKHYKKLKHQFAEKYPEVDLLGFIKFNTEHVENQKRKQYQSHKAITKLSERFIAYLQITSGYSLGGHIAIRPFIHSIESKYKITYDEKKYLKIAEEFDPECVQPKKEMLIEDIHFLATILGKQIESISEDDMLNVEMHVNRQNGDFEEKLATARHIVKKQVDRFKKLHTDYIALKNESDKLLS